MSISPKIQPHHLTRQAAVYIRQSTPKQVQLNQESTRRQYQLADRAREWGWPQPLIKVIDDDLGLSGTSSTHRLGFQRLIAAISLGEVGLVLVTEVSRLSRLNSDWHRVIELCAVFETLMADEDGLYDPRDPNDRLLLGLKGTLFAAELHILRARMRGNLLNKARRGELALRLPVGYRRLHDDTMVLEPDEQARQALNILFEQFNILKSGRAVQRYFQQHQLKMPRLIQTGVDYGRLIWVSPTYQMIQQVLTSPVYAGVFVYGRRKNEVIPGDPPQTRTRRLLIEEWEIVIPDVYPAYISYDQYLANRQILRSNLYNFEKKGRGAAREGRGLLQGILICGRCGRRMTPSYGSDYLAYVCRREQMTYGTKQCQAFPMAYLDQAISEVFLAAVQPCRLEATLAALARLEQERQVLDRQWQLRLERARYQARLAERQYDAVDPENRLVARSLEKRWNEALVELNQLEQDYAAVLRSELAPLTEVEQPAVRQLAHDLPALWQAPTTTMTDRKRLLRLVIQEVTLTAEAKTRKAEYIVSWSGGVTTTHVVQCPPIGWHCVTDDKLVQRIRELADNHPDHRIAELLNAEGIRTQTGKEWTYQRVKSIRKQHQIPTTCPLDVNRTTPRGDGLVPVKTAAQLLHVSPATVHLWADQGILVHDQRVSASYLWVRVNESDLARLNGSLTCDHLPTIADIIRKRQLTRDEVWALVRAGQYTVYRVRRGGNWEWRLQETASEA
ncbi:MAG: recombinase family protein [Chloroflexi bacterium]|nr:recombinase family protein [Chloroflexota bacterium]MCI0643712.1 recombinase family protein [Chloroflexota bacterium]MCI0729748.1 recombinase family protein [Chloroflexota bacterium]